MTRVLMPFPADAALASTMNQVASRGWLDEAKRYYPSDALAANVVGFVGAEDKGLDGIELCPGAVRLCSLHRCEPRWRHSACRSEFLHTLLVDPRP